MVLCGEYGPPFNNRSTRIMFDIAFWVVALLHILGNYLSVPGTFSFWTFLDLLKPVPQWIMIAKLWNIQRIHPSIEKNLIGLDFMSIGGIFLLINKFAQVGNVPTIYFILAAITLCLGYVCYTFSFFGAAVDSADDTFRLKESMTKRIIYVFLFILIVAFAMVSLSKLIADLPDTHNFLSWQLPIYTTFLLLEVLAVFFYFFTCNHLDEYRNYATILAIIGSLFAIISDDLLAHYTLNNSWHIRWWSALFLLTYYLADFLIAKSGVKTAAYFNSRGKVI